jgi:riboflavin biosynthesis pyrimidine reductase
MNCPQLISLYPQGRHSPVEAKGLYLRHRLNRCGASERPCVYSNYVVSLDGRIAIGMPGTCRTGIPETITSDVDWRLYQELAAQADVLLTSGRYLRELAEGKAQDTFPVGTDFPDLQEWRKKQGLTPQPHVVVLTRSLELPLAELLPRLEHGVTVATGIKADKRKLAAVAETGVPVLLAGDDDEVDGCRLIEELGDKGFRSIYSIAGPGLLDTLLRAGKVDRLYLTQVHTLLGGQCYDTLLESRALEPAARFELEELYFDRGDEDRQGQMFGVYRKGG